jgi:hypothetical protein
MMDPIFRWVIFTLPVADLSEKIDKFIFTQTHIQ